jgi:ribosomal protein S21
MVTVIVRKNDSLDKTIKRFEAKCRRAQIFKIMQQKSYYMSPSEKRHRRRKHKSRVQ